MQQHQNYTRDILAGQEEALSKIVEKIPFRSVVLDIGCGTGMMGRFLSENRECVVDGVDIDAEAIAIARSKYRTVGVFNLESDRLLGSFNAETYDCIVMADIIEHLVHPEQLFEDVKKLLKPNGKFLFSIPNITHISAGLELVLGKFGYQNSGLLDATHVRFYSRESFINKLDSCGIYVDEIDTIERDIDNTEFPAYENFPKKWIRDLVHHRTDALTYQWIISASLYKPAKQKNIQRTTPALSKKYLSMHSRLYWSSVPNPNLSEVQSIAGSISTYATAEQVLTFDFTHENCDYPLTGLRIDLVSDESIVLFYDCVLVSPTNQVLWTANDIPKNELRNAEIIVTPQGYGRAIVPVNSDPQWCPAIDSRILNAIEPGCSLRIRLQSSEEATTKAILFALRSESEQLQGIKQEVLSKTVEAQALSSAIFELEAALRTRTAECAASSNEISFRIAESQSLEKQYNEALHSRVSLEHELAQLSQEATALRDNLANAVSTLESRTHEFDSVKAHYQEQLLTAESNHQKTRQTISWRVTAPLRWLRGIFN